MSSMLSLFSLQALDKLDLEILDFWLFMELSILEWFLTWFFKFALMILHTHFKLQYLYDRVHGLPLWY